MMPTTNRPKAKFGTVLGYAHGGVAVYSSDYDSIDTDEFPDRSSFRSIVDGHYMGFKWQCVELARRWLYVNKGYVFDDVAMAYDIFSLSEVKVVENGQSLPIHSFRNGCIRPPEPGSLLIWNEGGEFHVTGHVAVVTSVTDSCVRIVEQNVEDTIWHDGVSWSRELPVRVDSAGRFWVDCTYDNASILGWVMQTGDPTHAEPRLNIEPELFRIIGKRTDIRADAFLDPDEPADRALIESMGGHRLATRDEDLDRYFVISESAEKELKRATNELHALFLHATAHVLREPELLARFGFPEALVPRIRQSWENRRTHVITGRFDFAMTPNGLKVYEYNVDSASCHMECGRVQGAWARAHDVTEGRDAGENLQHALIEAWKDSHVDSVVHLFRDEALEEIYHTRFMRQAIEAARLECRVVNGVEGLRWGEGGRVVDADGTRIDWVWKTWAWETALDELRAEVESEAEFLAGGNSPQDHPPRLIDVLLHPDVMVFEPLWTLIPSNKAILPVLWSLMPNHPYLLEAHFDLTDSLRESGYVAKPIVGRCGRNISLIGANDVTLAETGGQFESRDQVFQALFKLPEIDGLRTQVCTFTADGHFAGTCVRCDPSLVIKSESDVLPLRIIPDAEFAAL